MMSKCKEIIIDTNSKGSELVADAFFSIGCNGVKIIDKEDLFEVQKDKTLYDYIEEQLFAQSDIVKVSGFVSEESLQQKLEQLSIILSKYHFVYDISVVDCNTDWYNNWKEYYKPIEVGKYAIVPEWHNYKNIENRITVKINPGMAFGTGQHQSTKLSLCLMSLLNIVDKKVIDIGTGSGILGIAAIKSGARSCYMCDIDSLATRAAKDNLMLNQVEDGVIVENIDLAKKQPQQADIILANLTADILLNLSNTIRKNIACNGKVVCSGIIKNRYNEVVDNFKSQGFKLEHSQFMDDWSAILLRSN